MLIILLNKHKKGIYMKDITLEQLLEAGCHFGHKAERWHPKASEFIWAEKDGIHIIDLAKTKAGLDTAIAFVRTLAEGGGTLLFVGTKRQARGVVKAAAVNAGASYLTQRWIGGFMTNWDGVHKNIQRIIKMMDDQKNGGWKKFPKHEQTKMARELNRLNVDYEGVLSLSTLPNAIFVVDVKKEQLAVREAKRLNIPVIGVVDTNADPSLIDYVIPANDDAVGSVELVVNAIAESYREGREVVEKEAAKATAAPQAKSEVSAQKTESATEEKTDKPVQKEAKAKKEATPEAK
jgi:small subunit ribosomal protein S2